MAAASPYYFPINQLPDHILLKIFLQLEGWSWEDLHTDDNIIFPCEKESLLPPIAYVCSRWRRLYFEPQMWRSKVIDVAYLNRLRPDSQFFAVLNRMAGEIRHLKIHCSGGRPTVSLEFLRLSPIFPSVEQLTVDTTSDFEDALDLGILLGKFPATQSFEMRDVELDDVILLQMASGWKNLRKFDVSRCTSVTGAGLIRFAQLANHIESVNISGLQNLTDSDFDEITMGLGDRLKSIIFGYKQKKLSELAIISLVQNCPNLEQIWLAVPLPIGRLKDLPHLKSLTLQFPTYSMTSREFKVPFDDCPGFEDLFSRPLSQFRSFKATGVGNLTDSLMELIANSCPHLESLNLSLCDNLGISLITDSGVAHIVNKCRNLRVLCLYRFPLLTGRSFIGAGAKLPNLSRLELHKCRNIDPDVVRRAFVRSTRLQIRSDLPGPWDLRRFVPRRLDKRRLSK